MAMLRHRAVRSSGAPARLLYSARDLDDVIYRSELERLAAGEGLEMFLTLTRSRPEGWTGYGRRVDAEMLAEVAWPPERLPMVYVCGPTPFVESVAGSLVTLGHDPGRIRTERFGPTGG
jgi:ferredoxin-NADP reductase